MFLAVLYGHEVICKLLYDAESDINEVHKESGKSLLHTAIDHGHVKVTELLINLGADLNKHDNDGNPQLHLFAQLNSQNEELAKLLITKGNKQKFRIQNNDADTPLHIAIESRHFETRITS